MFKPEPVLEDNETTVKMEMDNHWSKITSLIFMTKKSKAQKIFHMQEL